MKKLIILLLGLIVCPILSVTAQVVTSEPTPLEDNSTGVVIYFHADQGNKGLMGVSSSTAIYAHTGVCVMSADGTSADWKYAPTWLTNTAKYKLEYVSTNLWKLNIGNLREYYGVAANETITRLCFVFRDATGNKSGRAVGGGDIFLDVKSSSSSKPSSLTKAPAQGVTRNADGSTTFCVAAPGKNSVMVLGSWNDYVPSDSQMLEYIDENVSGTVCRFFTITLPASVVDSSKPFFYYYLVDNAIRVGDPYANLVLDESNDKWIPASTFPNLPAFPTKVSGVALAWYNPALFNYNWNITSFTPANKTNLVVYELLLRDFTGTEGVANAEGTVRKAIEKIPYLKALGINAVELLPINEFNGNNSWGYNPNFYFAPDKAYGTPADYKEFIDKCHAEGIAVILDMVFNQADGQHPWYKMYETGSNPFFNAVAPHAYSVLNDWNQGYPMVERQWKDALQYWLREFKVDGFRFDLVKGLGNNDSYSNSGDAATNAYNQSRIDRMIRLHGYMKEVKEDAIFINEDLATPAEENAMAVDGQLNWANINTEGRNYAAAYSGNSGLNRMWANDDQRNPGSTVAYLESHDEERLGYAAKTSTNATVKGSKAVQMLRLGSAAAQMILVPGSHMIWQFSELGNDQTTKNSDWSNNTNPKIVNWSLMNDPLNAGLLKSYQELIALRLSNVDLFPSEKSPAGFSMNCYASNWANGRTIIATNADKELYTVINPNVTGSINVTVPFRTANNSAYTIMSKSYETMPEFDSGTGLVTVPANSYVCIGSKNVAASVEEIGIETANGFSYNVANGILYIAGATSAVEIFNLQGIRVATLPAGDSSLPLPSGIYLLNSNGKTIKVHV